MRRLSQSVLIALTCTAAQWAVARTPGPIPPAPDVELARDILREMVDINTTHEHGTTGIAQVMQQQLINAGFSPEDVVFIVPPDKPSKGNLVVHYRAKGHERRKSGSAVLFMGHLDVVEAKREDWSTEPFSLTEQEGFYYGRGTEDMKGGDAAMLETLIRFKREHYAPARDLIVAFTADEEAGGDANGPAFLLKEHRELIDAGLAINLDGAGGALKNGERLYFPIRASEKVYVTYTLETTSAGGHGSLPTPDNAIYRMADGLARLEKFQFPVVTTATTQASFQKFAALETGQTHEDMLAVARTPADPDAAERLSQTVRFNAQLRTTCVATLISGGHAENALPQRARVTIQCRMMPGDTAENVQSLLTNTLADPGISILMDTAPIPSPESPPTMELLQTAGKVVHSMWPGVAIIPVMATGFSDSRQTRNAGIPTYAMGGVWGNVDDYRAHGRDERIGVREFDESVEFVYRLMKAFSSR